MPKQAKQAKQGKYLWNVTVREAETNLSETYTLTEGTLMKADFARLSKRALSIARKNKGNWHEPSNLYVSAIEASGTIDG